MEPIRRFCILFFSVIFILTFLYGQIQISESVTQFRYPKFSDNGYIEWVLEGNSGDYMQSDIAIDGMKLRIYSGDQLGRSLSTITGENCNFNSDSQIATSDNSIIINGSGFNLSGNQWTYDLSKEIIDLKSDSFVRFSQNIDSIFSGIEKDGETTIKGDQMRLIIEPDRYLFFFEGDCILSSESFILKAKSLEIELLNSSNKIEFSIPTGELSGMKSIKGNGDVQFIGMGQSIQSDYFFIEPPEDSAIFGGNAIIEFNQISLKGDLINWKQNFVEILSFNNNLSSFSNSNLDTTNLNKDPSSIFIQSSKITLLKQEEDYEYVFNENVLFLSEFYRINADFLFLKTEEIQNDNTSEILQKITMTEATGNVIVKHQDYLISGQYLNYLPLFNQLELKDEVSYISDFVRLRSDFLNLENDILLAHSSKGSIEVVLPNTSDLDFEFNESNLTDEESTHNLTTVNSSDLKITFKDFNYECFFSNSVKLIKNDFSLSTDFLTMKWTPVNTGVEDVKEYKMETMLADGSVKMEQIDYYATAHYAEILPDIKMIHLWGDAYFKDANGSIWGDRIEFDRKIKQTKVLGSEDGKRARVQIDLFGAGEEKLEDSKKNDVK